MLAAHPDEAARLGREAAACYDLRRAAAVKERVDNFARELSLQPNSQELLEALRDGARAGGAGEATDGAAGAVMNYVGDHFGAMPYVDLFALAERASRCEALDRETRDAATELMGAVDELVVASFGMDGLTGFEPGHHGVFIAFPDGDREVERAIGSSTVWSRMGWYTPLAPSEPGQPYGRWAFLADGATARGRRGLELVRAARLLVRRPAGRDRRAQRLRMVMLGRIAGRELGDQVAGDQGGSAEE